LIPAMIGATIRFGAIGAAGCWLAFHGTAFVIAMTMTHARFLRGQRGTWLWRSVVVPASIALLVCAMGRLLISDGSRIVLLLLIAVTGAAAFFATALTTPVVQEWIAEHWQRRDAGRT